MENLELTPGFWKDRRVLVTGHTGFKGGWLTIWMELMGAKLAGYALSPSSDPNLFTAANVSEGISSITGDVADLRKLSQRINEFQPEIVFHLAAQALVRRSYLDPVETYRSNALGTVHVLEAARQCGSVRAVIIVTSDKCYRNLDQDHAFREHEPLGGDDPYSSSKACAELITHAYREAFFSSADVDGSAPPQLASVRAGNVLGGGDWADDRLVPDFMRAFAAGHEVAVRNPQSIRPWQHVLDPLHGYLVLAQCLHDGEPGFAEAWNFGPEDSGAKPVGWLADKLCELWGEGASWKHVEQSAQPAEAHLLKLDAGKARERLAWQPRLNLEQTLAWTVEWYRGFADGASARDLCEAQIERFKSGP